MLKRQKKVSTLLFSTAGSTRFLKILSMISGTTSMTWGCSRWQILCRIAGVGVLPA